MLRMLRVPEQLVGSPGTARTLAFIVSQAVNSSGSVHARQTRSTDTPASISITIGSSPIAFCSIGFYSGNAALNRIHAVN